MFSQRRHHLGRRAREKKGKEKYVSIIQREALLPDFAFLCRRLSLCVQTGGHPLETCTFITLLRMKI